MASVQECRRLLDSTAGLPEGLVVREAVAASGWKVHAQKANLGYIEATASTPFFGFRDDVVIRVTEQAGTVRVDMRSASRVGLSDLGVNAGRIRDFMEMIAQ